MKNKFLLIFILVLYIVIPILILNNKFLYDIKFYLLTVIGLIVFLFMKLYKVSNKELGITKNNYYSSIKRNFVLILICLIAIIILKLFHIDKYNPNETIVFYIFYILSYFIPF